MEKTLGGDRLGSGKRMKVHLHNYERSTHDLGYIFRSTMAAGTLVPFLKTIALPGDTFDINLNCDVKTHPTVGPLFGSFKVQLDVFLAPMRLYQGQLHNNKLGIGMNMANVKLPFLTLETRGGLPDKEKIDNSQVNPSSILSYLGIRGVGLAPVNAQRKFNGVPFLTYWDIYKNYYANKQEEIGAVIHNAYDRGPETVTEINVGTGTIPKLPGMAQLGIGPDQQILIDYNGGSPNLANIMVRLDSGVEYDLNTLAWGAYDDTGAQRITAYWSPFWVNDSSSAIYWRYRLPTDLQMLTPKVKTFPLENIDKMREAILAASTSNNAFDISGSNLTPYIWATGNINGFANIMGTQEGLAIKTYQSDLFNNWLSTEWIDGAGGITEVTSIDTTGGSFSIDTLNLSRKVYDMLNRIAVSGGTYDDWIDAVYTHDRYTRCESPMYMGGLIKELEFQEVVSNTGTDSQELGTLAGKGVMSKKHKGGYIHINVDEPSYVIGIVSLTPRMDYSQGNDWDVHLATMDDLHKPALDEIGFQELITEQMAWWDTEWNSLTLRWDTKSAGKQPAWINYMTNINRTYGNFAVQSDEMFMTLNRRYEYEQGTGIKDLTTYIDPVKSNYIFAETSLDAQNFWVQVGIDMKARRKMSAKVMPNL